MSDAISIEALLLLLRSRWQMQAAEPIHCSSLWYDSFDWRLYQAGFALRVEETKGQGTVPHLDDERSCLPSTLQPPKPVEISRERKAERALHSLQIKRWYLVRLVDGALCAEVLSSQTPGFAQELPEAMQAHLLALLGPRRLLPRLAFRGKRWPLAMLDDQGKIRVRLEIWQGESQVTEARPAFCARLFGLKGYAQDLAKLRRSLEKAGWGQWLYQAEPLDWLGDHGQRPGDYSAKLDFAFAPTMAAAGAVLEILGFLLQVIRANLSGAGQGQDSEFLHDLRVAVRRTRSALGQLKVFTAESMAVFREGFGWLGQITGPTRDLDVHLLQFPAYLALIPVERRAALMPLHDRIKERQRLAQARLAEELSSERCQSFLQSWQNFLQANNQGRFWSQVGSMEVKAMASRRIWRSYGRLVQDGLAIGDESSPEALHELRKDCKKLRYLLEFFQNLYPQVQILRLVRATKALLDCLGRFQDLEVQARSLEGLSEGLFAKDSPGQEAKMFLFAALSDEQRKEQALFAKRFATLRKQQGAYKKLFVYKHKG